MTDKPSYEELERRVGELNNELVTSRHKDEELRENKNFLVNVFSSIQDGISILDPNLNIIRVNHTMEGWYSHAMPLQGRKCFEAYHGRATPCEICPVRKTIETGQAAYEIVPKRGPAGKIIGWLDLYSFPLFDSATGQFQGIIEYVRDITERRQTEETLQKAHAELEERVRKRTAELAAANMKMQEEIEERKATEEALRCSETELARKKAALEETNTALKVLLKKLAGDNRRIEEQVLVNVKELIEPCLEKLLESRLDEKQRALADILKSNINDIVSPFVRSLSFKNLKLTPAEIRVALLIRQGKSTKEIAEFMHLSPETINVYRKKIRKKCGIANKKLSLRAILSSVNHNNA